MANNYDSFVHNDRNPFAVENQRNPFAEEGEHPLGAAGDSGKSATIVDDSENEEGAPNSGFVIHVATEPVGKAPPGVIPDLPQ